MNVNGRFQLSFILACIVMAVFATVKVTVLIGHFESSPATRWTEFVCFLLFIPIFYCLIEEYLKKAKKIKEENNYITRLNRTIIHQSHNSLFYRGDIINGAMELTQEVAQSIGADRCSIWLYNEDKTSIVCQQLYVKSENRWYTDIELFKKDFAPYFRALEENPIIIANDAASHASTSCFKESYLTPLNIASMLDVPIVYKAQTIGVICIESHTPREWKECESQFAQNLSSLYSFAYSVADSYSISQDMVELNHFLDAASIISKTDAKGRIIYVNKKFEEISGWSLEEVVGKNHRILNSGVHPKSFWKEMYESALMGKIWNAVCTNKRKDGSIYHVDTYIKAEFEPETGKLRGFTSIRQDVTELMNSIMEIEKKNTYLEHAAKILRHDMHSGINTYIPRGLSSLERRLKKEDIDALKLEAPLKMIKEGLKHTQKVYKGVYEFTNLVKKDIVLTKTKCNIKTILEDFLSSTSYRPQVILSDDLPELEVNEALFCTAIDNLIRNGLKYNDSDNKVVKIYHESSRKKFELRHWYLVIEDNGRGIDQAEFEHLSKPYVRKEGQKEAGTGLGLNICRAILQEHGYTISAEKLKVGTKLKIRIK